MKLCIICNQFYPATKEYFHADKYTFDEFVSCCKGCRKHRNENPVGVKTPREGYKYCGTCENELPADSIHFAGDSSTSTGLHSRCKVCTQMYSIIRYRHEKDRILESNAIWSKNHKERHNILRESWNKNNRKRRNASSAKRRAAN